MDRAVLPPEAGDSLRSRSDSLTPAQLLESLGLKADAGSGDKLTWLMADLAVSFRRIAGALEHQAAAVPTLTDDRSRWMFRVAEQAIREHPRQPESVTDQRTRCAMLAENLGDRLADYSLDDATRKAKWAREKAAREPAAQGSTDGNGAATGAGSAF